MQSTEQNRIYTKQLNIFDLVPDRFFHISSPDQIGYVYFYYVEISIRTPNSRGMFKQSSNSMLVDQHQNFADCVGYHLFAFYICIIPFMLVFFFHSEHSFTLLIDLCNGIYYIVAYIANIRQSINRVVIQ